MVHAAIEHLPQRVNLRVSPYLVALHVRDGARLFFCANHFQELFELVLLSRQRTHRFCQILLVVANLLRNILARLVHQAEVMHPVHGCLKPQSDPQTNRGSRAGAP